MKKELLFFIDSMVDGGAERVISVLTNQLVLRNYDVSIVMLRKKPIFYNINDSVNIIYADDIPVRNVYGKAVRKAFEIWNRFRQRVYVPLFRRIGKKDKLPKWNETSFYFYATYAMPYRELLKKNKGCTAFGFLIRSNISLLMAAKGTGVKTVYCERNNPVRPDMPKNIMKIRDRIYKRCDAAVFQTNEELEYYTKIKGKKAVIPNPLNDNLPERFTGERRHEIVNFCRLSKQKRIPLLIDAFAMLLNDYPDYTLCVYGNGEEKDNILEYIKENHLENKVFIEPFAKDIHDKIKDAAMFAFTSDFEGLSNSMLEAMAIGLPCVCTDCDGGGARMMIRDHVNGLLVPKGDVNAVYIAMKEIIENKALAEKLSLNAEKLRNDLSVDKIVEKWIKVI